MEKNHIGQKLKEMRNKLSLTQRQVAEYVGVTEATVSRWESGEIDNMRRDKIARLAEILKISPLLIMGIEVAEYSPENHEESKLIASYRGLNNFNRQQISNIISAFLSQQAAVL